MIDIATIKAIQSESVAKDFIPALSSIEIPTLVIRGHQPGAALSEADADTYKSSMPHCHVPRSKIPHTPCGSPTLGHCHSRVVGQFARTIEHLA